MAGRPGRTILLGLAVWLAGALVVAVSSGIISMQAGVSKRIDRSIGETDARVAHRYNGTVPASLVDEIGAWPGVEVAAGRLAGSLTLARADGARNEDGRPLRLTVQARGTDVAADERFAQVELDQGRLARTNDEVVVDSITLTALRASLGDRLVVQRFGPPVELEIVGVVKRPLLGALQRPRVQLSRTTLADASGRGDEVSLVSIILKEDVDPEAWVEANADRVQDPLVLDASERVRAGFDRQVRASRIGFVTAALIAFLACGFIVATGMTTAVAEQQREMAIARCIGGSRSQLFASQLLVGLVICGGAGVLSLPFGALLARGLVWWFAEFLPAGFVFSWLGATLALVGSLFAGIAGALFPAFLAARVSPLSALTVRARPPRGDLVVGCALIGIALIGVQLLLSLIPAPEPRFWVYSILGMPALHIGWFLLSPAIARLLAPVVGTVLERVLAIPRGLLAGSLRAQPFRLGFTAGALMVGVSILVSTWSNGQALLENLDERVRFADGFVFRTSGLTVEQQEAIAEIPGVLDASPVGYLPLRVVGNDIFSIEGLAPSNVICIGFEPESFMRLNRIEFLQGTPEAAIPRLRDGDAVLVAEEFLVSRRLALGDMVALGPEEEPVEFEIVGVVTAAGLDIATQYFGIRSLYMENAMSCVFMDFAAVARHFDSREAFIVQFRVPESFTDEDEALLGERVREAVPGAVFASGRAIRRLVHEVGDTMLGVSAGVAFAALLLASFGVGNVVAAGVAARRFEYGVLRAVGSSRGLLARLVLAETVLIAIVAAISGGALGAHLAWMGTTLYQTLGGITLRWIFPTGPFLLASVVVLAICVCAAVPTVINLVRRSSRELLTARG